MRNSIKKLRERRGLLQKDVAAILGIPKSTYAAYEQGISEAGYDVLRRLSRLYQVPINHVIDAEGKTTYEISQDQAERLRGILREAEAILEESGITAEEKTERLDCKKEKP